MKDQNYDYDMVEKLANKLERALLYIGIKVGADCDRTREIARNDYNEAYEILKEYKELKAKNHA
jgi:hypothetical protein